MSIEVAVESERARDPRSRLESLCDSGSFEAIRSQVRSFRLGERARDGDGVVGGLGAVDGRPIACYAQDAGYLGGSLGAAHADTIDRVLQIAERSRIPVVAVVDSGGARLQEGIAALGGYSRIFRRNVALSGVVPQISIVGGLAAGGGCYSPALTDFVVMTRAGAMFLTGPAIVREVTGEEIDVAGLGGPRIHERNGVCDAVAPDAHAAISFARSLLRYLPLHAGDEPPRTIGVEPELSDPGVVVPDDPRKVYDVREAIAGIVDGGSVLELAPRWARNLVTALARLDGQPVGVIANQPRYSGGVLDTASAQKGARFVQTCDRYGIPLLVLVDTPGFMPGAHQEREGVIRFGATLVRAFASATVARVTVVLRKAYGGAYITMNSKDLGADMVFAWPGSELGVMGARPAVGIVNRRDLAAAEDPIAARDELEADYAARHLSSATAAAGGFVDEVIAPAETRARLIWALSTIGRRRSPR
ncbi:MAG TPA: carboxyl transferase domain-containing protein [Thermoleophilaceae bacterium]|nr:carboxyl transferase domain-containing protein [Thermoleophilaceae bacterium]